MKLGSAVRKLMPSGLERKAAAAYRRVFVDLRKVAISIAPFLPRNARLLDIGGGDGELLNHLLEARPDVTVAMVDVAPSVGKFVNRDNLGRVRLFPGTSIEAHIEGLHSPYDAALVSDVMHHLPPDYRGRFLQSVHTALVPSGVIFVKDIEPGYFLAWLSLMCDMYVSGDRGVVLVSQGQLRELASTELCSHKADEIGLFERNPPNYVLKLDFSAQE